MNFAKQFLKNNPINIKNIEKCNDILPLQYKLLAPKFMMVGSIRVPHSYSNKHDPIKMRNTLELLYELFRR